MTKNKCSFSAKCKFCSKHSCFFCIDAILNKFQVQSRSDHWYKHFNALCNDYHWLKVQGHKKAVLETDFCHACEFSRRLNVLFPLVCYEDEENIDEEYDSEEELFEDTEEVTNSVSQLSIDSFRLKEMQNDDFLLKASKSTEKKPSKKRCFKNRDKAVICDSKNVSNFYCTYLIYKCESAEYS